MAVCRMLPPFILAAATSPVITPRILGNACYISGTSRQRRSSLFARLNFIQSSKHGALDLRKKSTAIRARASSILPDVWELNTEPFGKLVVKAPFHVDIRPMDPLSCPDQNRVQVMLKNEEENLQPQWMDAVQCHVTHDSEERIVNVIADVTEASYELFPSLSSLPVIIEAQVPISFDVDVTTRSHGRVSVKGLECDSVQVVTDAGQSLASGLKASKLKVTSALGDITSRGSLYGDITLSTAGAGSISLNKTQGSLNAITEAGSILVKSAYATRCCLATTGGDVRVTTLTGDDNQVSSLHGDLILDSIDGCLEARTQTGNITASFSRVPSTKPSTATLVADVASDSGDITLHVSPEVNAHVVATGEKVNIDEKLRYRQKENGIKVNISSNNENIPGEGKPDRNSKSVSGDQFLQETELKVGNSDTGAIVRVSSQLGIITLSIKDWFAAFKFG